MSTDKKQPPIFAIAFFVQKQPKTVKNTIFLVKNVIAFLKICFIIKAVKLGVDMYGNYAE